MEKVVRLTRKTGFYGQFGYTFIYTFEDSNRRVYVWKTGSLLELNDTTVNVNSTIKIKYTEKCESLYNGVMQKVITRVKVLDIITLGPSEEEVRKERARIKKELEDAERQRQMDSLRENDIIKEVSYRQYKTRYADCETLKGSFVRYNDGRSIISIILRNGRRWAVC